MDSRSIGLISVAVLVAGILMIVGGFYMSARGGSSLLFVLGAVVTVAGIILSSLDMRGFFRTSVPKKKSSGKVKGH